MLRIETLAILILSETHGNCLSFFLLAGKLAQTKNNRSPQLVGVEIVILEPSRPKFWNRLIPIGA